MQGEVIYIIIMNILNSSEFHLSPPGSGRVERGVSVSLPEEEGEGGRRPSLHRKRLRVDRSEPGLSVRMCLELRFEVSHNHGETIY